MKKLRKYKDLAEELENCRLELKQVVADNQDLDGLNFGETKVLSHGDLNSANIFLDPNTYDIIGIIDWGSCMHGYELDKFKLGFLSTWFEKTEDRQSFVVERLSLELSTWFKRSMDGERYRKYFRRVGYTANEIVVNLSNWLGRTQHDPNLEMRINMDKSSRKLRELLIKWPDTMREMREYRKPSETI